MQKFYRVIFFMIPLLLIGCNSRTQEELEAQEMVQDENSEKNASLIVETRDQGQ